MHGSSRHFITFVFNMPVSYSHDEVVPDSQSDKAKKTQVADMFDSIAHRYDFLNRFLSAGIDRSWRKKALSKLKNSNPSSILDVATGTADLAIMAADILNPNTITGIDISSKMLDAGRIKINHKGLNQIITLKEGDSEAINYPNDSFDAVTVAFGVRNFQDLEKGLSEIRRVLKPGGQLVVLEFSKPKIPVWSHLYKIYMKYITPIFAGWFTKNKTAYIYLNNSIQAFPEGKDFLKVMYKTGFKQTSCEPLSFGISTIYTGIK
jgi:demethylmenaquinone methyltransferase/2-methoxy-6-polyprenyl-1,4-benzoquinol methylase